MIGILLNDTAYEQDIRELLMAFYPGETFVHERQDDVDFYVEGTCTQNADETKFGLRISMINSFKERAEGVKHAENHLDRPGLPVHFMFGLQQS